LAKVTVQFNGHQGRLAELSRFPPLTVIEAADKSRDAAAEGQRIPEAHSGNTSAAARDRKRKWME
jgi:hypothetical protein